MLNNVGTFSCLQYHNIYIDYSIVIIFKFYKLKETNCTDKPEYFFKPLFELIIYFLNNFYV